MHYDGEHHDDRDDAVETLSIGHVGGEQEAAQQDRHGPFKPGEQNEVALVAFQPGRDQAQPDQDRPDDECKRRPENEPGDPHVGLGDHAEIDGETKDDEGDDLGETGQR